MLVAEVGLEAQAGRAELFARAVLDALPGIEAVRRGAPDRRAEPAQQAPRLPASPDTLPISLAVDISVSLFQHSNLFPVGSFNCQW